MMFYNLKDVLEILPRALLQPQYAVLRAFFLRDDFEKYIKILGFL